jgi:hypothetical protein
MDRLIGVPIVLTEKMDGSNTSLEREGCFARTHAGAPTHKSFDQLKALHATIKHLLPKHIQYFGEWCYAKHSIAYEELPGYFLMFGIRELQIAGYNIGGKEGEDLSYWYDWQTVEDMATILGVHTVPVLFKGQVSSEKELQELVERLMKQPSVCGGVREGVVARVNGTFKEPEFSSCVMKCVRANHVQTTEHWKDQEITKNKLKL